MTVPALNPVIAEAVAARGYADLTPVQVAVTDPALQQADLLVSAQTGSGKTVGFGLAIAPTLLGDAGAFDPAAAPLALVIAPTRELALQVRRELEWLYAGAGAVLASCVGGMDMRDERRALDRGAHIVVATPGRLRDHITRGSMDMSSLRAVVLDEADEMLDLGFREDLEFILAEAPETRRTLMFSATVPRAIAKLAENYLRDAQRVTTLAEREAHADIDYRALNVATQDAENAVVNVLRYYEAQNAIVFCNTRAMVNRMATRLGNRGFQTVALSGELSQEDRSHALQALRDGRARVCVATDVAARGIDLPNLDLVVHAELPSSADTLKHRSGRTGRAGRKGVSALIVPPGARRKAENLMRFARVAAAWEAAPSADAVHARDEERLLADAVWTTPAAEDERTLAAKLSARFSAADLALACLRLYRSRLSAPEDLSPVPAFAGAAPDRPKREPGDFGPSVWFRLSAGRNQRLEPRWLMPRLCRAGGITRNEIGAIRLLADESFVEISQSVASDFTARLGAAMQIDGGVTLTELASPPDLGQPRQDAPPPKPRESREPRQFTGARAAREYRAANPKSSPKPLPKHLRQAEALAAAPKAAPPEKPATAAPAPKPHSAKPHKPKPANAFKPATADRPQKPDRPHKPAGPKPFAAKSGAAKPNTAKSGPTKSGTAKPGPKPHRKGKPAPGGMQPPRRPKG